MSTNVYSPLVEQIIQTVILLAPKAQQKVLDLTYALIPRGVPGKQLLRFAGMIEADDLDVMQHAIEAECERIDSDEW